MFEESKSISLESSFDDDDEETDTHSLHSPNFWHRLQGLVSSQRALAFLQLLHAKATRFPEAILRAVRMALPKDLLLLRAVIGAVFIGTASLVETLQNQYIIFGFRAARVSDNRNHESECRGKISILKLFATNVITTRTATEKSRGVHDFVIILERFRRPPFKNSSEILKMFPLYTDREDSAKFWCKDRASILPAAFRARNDVEVSAFTVRLPAAVRQRGQAQ